MVSIRCQEKIYRESMVRCWKRLPREVVDALSLEDQVGWGPGNPVYYPIWRLVALPVAGGLELDDP